MVLFRFGHKWHLVRIRKSSWFGLKHHKHSWKCPDISFRTPGFLSTETDRKGQRSPFKYLILVAKIMAGNIPRPHSKQCILSPQTLLEMAWFLENIQVFCRHKLGWNQFDFHWNISGFGHHKHSWKGPQLSLSVQCVVLTTAAMQTWNAVAISTYGLGCICGLHNC